jgi:hypothetical protein
VDHTRNGHLRCLHPNDSLVIVAAFTVDHPIAWRVAKGRLQRAAKEQAP